ncbi:MAG: M23 family metallopeptidase [Candidatus Fermentibacter sp.]|nr:M23 family metallopeptidase [Candidatus Fermentibacter sp.]
MPSLFRLRKRIILAVAAGIAATLFFMEPPAWNSGPAWSFCDDRVRLCRMVDSLGAILADTLQVRVTTIGDGFLGGALWDVGVTGDDYVDVCTVLRDSLGWSVQHAGDTIEASFTRGRLVEVRALPRGGRGFYSILFGAGGGPESWQYVRQEEWTRIRAVSCTVTSTVWQSLWDGALPEDLTPSGSIITDRDSSRAWAYISELQHELTDRLLAYDIDFYYDVQSGDRVFILLEEVRYPDASETGFRRIIAVKYAFAAGRTIEVFPFYHVPDSSDVAVLDHYHRDGASIRTMFLKMPVPFGRISSPFSGSRLHPVLGYSRAHNGTDYAAPEGTEIYAVGDGVITVRQSSGGYGNLVRIRHGNGYETGYGHMSSFAAGQSVGTYVRQGEIIGYVGSTGLSTGPHVHFEMKRNGTYVNPSEEILPPVDPLEGAELEAFQAGVTAIEACWARMSDDLPPPPEEPVAP